MCLFFLSGITTGLGKKEDSTNSEDGKKSPAASNKTDDDQFSMDI